MPYSNSREYGIFFSLNDCFFSLFTNFAPLNRDHKTLSIMKETSPATVGSSDSLVIIPTYNEKENVAAIIEAVFALDTRFDILIIDDNSPDGTALIVKGLMEKYSTRLHLIERQGKLGLGTAYIAGFKWAIEHGYEYVCEMDADFSHAPTDLPKLRI